MLQETPRLKPCNQHGKPARLNHTEMQLGRLEIDRAAFKRPTCAVEAHHQPFVQIKVNVAIGDLDPRVDAGQFQMLVRGGDQVDQIGEFDRARQAFDRPEVACKIKIVA